MQKILLLSFIFLSSFLFAQEKQMAFQRRKDSSRIFSVRMADGIALKMMDGKKKIGEICSYTDSTICFKENMIRKNKATIAAIMHDKSLNPNQRLAAYLRAIFPDSVTVKYDSIKKIQFSFAGDKKYRLQKILADALFVFADLLCLATISIDESLPNGGSKSSLTAQQGGEGIAVIAGSVFVLWKTHRKTIYTHRWKLKTSGIRNS